MSDKEKHIRLTKALVRDRYNEYNTTYFQGSLPKLNTVRFDYAPHYWAGVDMTFKGSKVKSVVITFSLYTYWSESLLLRVLLHEMIHVAVNQRHGKIVEPEHGEEFMAMQKALNDKYNLNITVGESEETIEQYVKPRFKKRIMRKSFFQLLKSLFSTS